MEEGVVGVTLRNEMRVRTATRQILNNSHILHILHILYILYILHILHILHIVHILHILQEIVHKNAKIMPRNMLRNATNTYVS